MDEQIYDSLYILTTSKFEKSCLFSEKFFICENMDSAMSLWVERNDCYTGKIYQCTIEEALFLLEKKQRELFSKLNTIDKSEVEFEKVQPDFLCVNHSQLDKSSSQFKINGKDKKILNSIIEALKENEQYFENENAEKTDKANKSFIVANRKAADTIPHPRPIFENKPTAHLQPTLHSQPKNYFSFLLKGNYYADHRFSGGKVYFVPEPENPHDENAVAVYQSNQKIGYVPRSLVSNQRDREVFIEAKVGTINSDGLIKVDIQSIGGNFQPSRNNIKPTDEQKQILNLSETCENIVIEAFAGSGKTTTLLMLCEKFSDKSILYLAFNSSIAKEARQKFPINVDVRTAHSLAYRDIGYKYKDRLEENLSKDQIFEFVSCKSEYNKEEAAVKKFLSNAINKTLMNFFYSPSNSILESHIPIEILNDTSAASLAKRVENIISLASEFFQKLKNEKEIKITHDAYFKIWALTNPKIEKDIIMLDEAQDSNPVLLHAIEQQSAAQKIYVGDKYQQIYSWRGAVNAIDSIQGQRAVLTKSFRFGEKISELANYVLKNLGSKVFIMGLGDPGNVSEVPLENFKAYIFRTNFRLIECLISDNRRISVIDDVSEVITKIREMAKFKNGFKPDNPIFSEISSWKEMEKFARSEDGQHLHFIFQIVDRNLTSTAIQRLFMAQSVPLATADCIYTTLHKAKGQEWDSVKVADDFRGRDHPLWNAEEDRLVYVAVTRAKAMVDISSCLDLFSELHLSR